MPDHSQAPRPNLPSLTNSTKLTPLGGNPPPIGSTSPVQQIKLPPISFLSNPSSAHSTQSPLLPQQTLGSQQGSPSNNNNNNALYPRPIFAKFANFMSNEGKDNQYTSPTQSQHSPVMQNISQQATPILASSNSLGLKLKSGSFGGYQQTKPNLTSATLPSQQTVTQPTSSSSSGSILHTSLSQTLPQLHTQSKPASLLSNSQPQATVQLKQEITKPEVTEESDEAIIKYYEDKYGLKDFTQEEKHDILQHEKRARIEKTKNPNYKTFLCYSIIKRLNAIPTVAIPTTAPPKSDIKPQPTVLQPLNLNNNNSNNLSNEPFKPLMTATNINYNYGVTAGVKPIESTSRFVKKEVKIVNNDVLESAARFPRKNLGSIIYTPTPTRETHRQLHLFKDTVISEEEKNTIVPLLPELNEYINCILTVRIPSFQIIDLLNNESFTKRAIWGTDIYTDDSDVLLVLKHNGFLPTQDSEVEQLIPNEGTIKSTPGNIDNQQNIQQNVSNFKHFLNIIGGDIHVDIIVLPKLTSYKGMYRNGINSRDWTSGHDGVSFALFGVRYGEKNSAIDTSNDSSIKKRKLIELYQMENSTSSSSAGLKNDKDDKYRAWKLDYKAWRTVKQQVELGKETSVGFDSDSKFKDEDKKNSESN